MTNKPVSNNRGWMVAALLLLVLDASLWLTPASAAKVSSAASPTPVFAAPTFVADTWPPLATVTPLGFDPLTPFPTNTPRPPLAITKLPVRLLATATPAPPVEIPTEVSFTPRPTSTPQPPPTAQP